MPNHIDSDKNIESQKELIRETDLDVLIILDACRHDYFKETYRNYLEGDLKMVNSEGGNTLMGLRETFGGIWRIPSMFRRIHTVTAKASIRWVSMEVNTFSRLWTAGRRGGTMSFCPSNLKWSLRKLS